MKRFKPSAVFRRQFQTVLITVNRLMFRPVILKDSSNILHLRNQHHIDDKHSDSKHTLDEIQQNRTVGKRSAQTHYPGRQKNKDPDRHGQGYDDRSIEEKIKQRFFTEFFTEPSFEPARLRFTVLFLDILFHHPGGVHESLCPCHQRIHKRQNASENRPFHPRFFRRKRFFLHINRTVCPSDCDSGTIRSLHHNTFHDSLPAHFGGIGVFYKYLAEIHCFYPLTKYLCPVHYIYEIRIAFRMSQIVDNRFGNVLNSLIRHGPAHFPDRFQFFSGQKKVLPPGSRLIEIDRWKNSLFR